MGYVTETIIVVGGAYNRSQTSIEVVRGDNNSLKKDIQIALIRTSLVVLVVKIEDGGI